LACRTQPVRSRETPGSGSPDVGAPDAGAPDAGAPDAGAVTLGAALDLLDAPAIAVAADGRIVAANGHAVAELSLGPGRMTLGDLAADEPVSLHGLLQRILAAAGSLPVRLAMRTGLRDGAIQARALTAEDGSRLAILRFDGPAAPAPGGLSLGGPPLGGLPLDGPLPGAPVSDLALADLALARILDLAPAFIGYIDSDRRYRFLNRAYERAFRRPREQLLGRPASEVLGGATYQQMEPHLTAALNGRSGIFTLYATVGQEVMEVQATCVPDIEEGLEGTGVRGVLVLGIDVTAQRRGEVALRLKAKELAGLNVQLAEAKRRAEEANRSKSDFLARVSHELRTPLNAIIGFSEIMSDELFGPVTPPRYAAYARDIHSSGRHLLDLVNDILDLARVETGKMILRDEPIRLDDLSARMLRLVAPSAEEKGLALTAELGAELPALVADQRAVKQMLLNLLANAVKFTLPGGRVVLRIAQEGGAVVLIVADTGIGIEPENIARCLEPFDQVDNVLTRRFAGSGLGLAITKALVERHGGRIDLRSTVGIGTEVRLFFPVRRSQRA